MYLNRERHTIYHNINVNFTGYVVLMSLLHISKYATASGFTGNSEQWRHLVAD